jgi:hypothetical protein
MLPHAGERNLVGKFSTGLFKKVQNRCLTLYIGCINLLTSEIKSGIGSKIHELGSVFFTCYFLSDCGTYQTLAVSLPSNE